MYLIVSQRIANLWQRELSGNKFASFEPTTLWVENLQINNLRGFQSTKVYLNISFERTHQIFSTFCILGFFMKLMSKILVIFMFFLSFLHVPKEIQSRTEYFVKETIFNWQKTKESNRRTFAPSWKKIRNLILSVRNETRYSKIDQESITHLKDKWMDYGNVLFEPFKKHIVVKEDTISGKQTHSYILFYLSIRSLVLFAFM